MGKFKLRKYQQDCVDKCNSIESGSHLVQMATGLGKTVTFASLDRQGRVLVLAHRKEILQQAQSYYDVPVGIEMGELKSDGEEIVAASVMSMVNRLEKFPSDTFDMIITDEAHHAVAPSYRKIYDHFKPRVHFGFTATPNRGDKVRLSDVFEDIIFSRDLMWGIANKFLSDIDCRQVIIDYNPTKIKTQKNKTTGVSDFMIQQLDEALNTPRTNEQIASAYKKYAVGQTLIFAATVDHAYALSKLIENSYVVESDTPPKVREQILEDFKNRKFPCLINNLIFTEGTDIPVIDTVIIARPTKNSTLYTQMVGRGLRIYEGKKSMRLIDCVGVVHDCSLCTAPSLLGLDPEKLHRKYRKKATEGLISEMGKRFVFYDNTPLSWVLRANKVELFRSENGLKFYNVAWSQLGDDTLTVATKNIELRIPPADLVQESTLQLYDLKSGLMVRESEKMPIQKLLDQAYEELMKKAGDQIQLWSTLYSDNWGRQAASQKQINYIKSLLTEEEFAELTEDKDRKSVV